MALENFCGFDYSATATDYTIGGSAVFSNVNSPTLLAGAANSGTYGARLGNTTVYCRKASLANAATRVLGFHHRFGSGFTSSVICAGLIDGLTFAAGEVQVGLCTTATGQIAVYRGRGPGVNTGGTLLGTSVNTLNHSQWYFIELVVTCHHSAGTVEVFVDDSKTGWIDLTGQDTTQTANEYSNGIFIYGTGAGTYCDFDNVYWLSGTGGTHTSRLGPVKCVHKVASAGDGTLAQFTPLSGTDNGAMVDEAAPDGNTSYNATSTAGHIDTYNFPAIGTTYAIYALAVRNNILKTDAGACNVRSVARIGSTNYFGTARDAPTAYGYNNDLWERSPATSAEWTAAEVDAAEFGIERNT
jgi:hypothetical protein